MLFWLGTHELSWLQRPGRPLFVSIRRFRRLRKWKRSERDFCLDSGGFSELSLFGGWRTPHEQYVEELHRVSEEVGPPVWAAPQDWMCEPWLKVSLDVEDRQIATVESLYRLREASPVHIIPVLQGWQADDYRRHIEMYHAVGFDLTKEPVVGVGSVCRRQGTMFAASLFSDLRDLGIKTHGFGVKVSGLRSYGNKLASADSMAWSFTARRQKIKLPGCVHVTCANCEKFADVWADGVERPFLN